MVELCRQYDPQQKLILFVSIIADVEECPETPRSNTPVVCYNALLTALHNNEHSYSCPSRHRCAVATVSNSIMEAQMASTSRTCCAAWRTSLPVKTFAGECLLYTNAFRCKHNTRQLALNASLSRHNAGRIVNACASHNQKQTYSTLIMLLYTSDK